MKNNDTTLNCPRCGEDKPFWQMLMGKKNEIEQCMTCYNNDNPN